MHQVLELSASGRRKAVETVSAFIAASVDAAPSAEAPFLHLLLERVFPDDIYERMMVAMPSYDDYRAMHGHSRHKNQKGDSTRVKIDLFPEYLRHLSPEQRGVWDIVGSSLRSRAVEEAFLRRLAPALEQRFGPGYEKPGYFFPIPILTRDIPGYRIRPHTDTHWKGITVQLYLPRDASTSHIGTIFHERRPNLSLRKAAQMPFVPNSGYAFVVGDKSWHSADPVGPEVETRDSILLTYFVDAGPLRFLRNRGKRIGNFLLNEFRSRIA